MITVKQIVLISGNYTIAENVPSCDEFVYSAKITRGYDENALVLKLKKDKNVALGATCVLN